MTPEEMLAEAAALDAQAREYLAPPGSGTRDILSRICMAQASQLRCTAVVLTKLAPGDEETKYAQPYAVGFVPDVAFTGDKVQVYIPTEEAIRADERRRIAELIAKVLESKP